MTPPIARRDFDKMPPERPSRLTSATPPQSNTPVPPRGSRFGHSTPLLTGDFARRAKPHYYRGLLILPPPDDLRRASPATSLAGVQF